ncbi:MAG: hypothetical protein COA54_09535 [Thiotrichaceae bacterium]|nr:MAG: hypothetical protein COA54_09535 [Thiotrichaceae bacterium]
MECVLKAREQIESIWEAIELCPVDGDAHKRFISAMLFVSFNHCDGIQILVQKKNFASAYALVRPLLETSFRAIWLHRCANEQQIQECMEKDKWKSAWDLVQEIEAYNGNTPILSNIWSEMRPLMHSYTHGGVQNAFRQLGDGNSVTPNIPDIEVFQLMQTVGLMSWLILAEVIDLSKNSDQLKLFEELGKGLNQWAFNKSIQPTANASVD